MKRFTSCFVGCHAVVRPSTQSQEHTGWDHQHRSSIHKMPDAFDRTCLHTRRLPPLWRTWHRLSYEKWSKEILWLPIIVPHHMRCQSPNTHGFCYGPLHLEPYYLLIGDPVWRDKNRYPKKPKKRRKTHETFDPAQVNTYFCWCCSKACTPRVGLVSHTPSCRRR